MIANSFSNTFSDRADLSVGGPTSSSCSMSSGATSLTPGSKLAGGLAVVAGLLTLRLQIRSRHEVRMGSELEAYGRGRMIMPPAVPVSDASVLAKDCDGVLMVVRANATPFDVARKAREQFPNQALVGVVLNGTHEEAVPYSRYYYEADAKDSTEPKS